MGQSIDLSQYDHGVVVVGARHGSGRIFSIVPLRGGIMVYDADPSSHFRVLHSRKRVFPAWITGITHLEDGLLAISSFEYGSGLIIYDLASNSILGKLDLSRSFDSCFFRRSSILVTAGDGIDFWKFDEDWRRSSAAAESIHRLEFESEQAMHSSGRIRIDEESFPSLLFSSSWGGCFIYDVVKCEVVKQFDEGVAGAQGGIEVDPNTKQLCIANGDTRDDPVLRFFDSRSGWEETNQIKLDSIPRKTLWPRMREHTFVVSTNYSQVHELSKPQYIKVYDVRNFAQPVVTNEAYLARGLSEISRDRFVCTQLRDDQKEVFWSKRHRISVVWDYEGNRVRDVAMFGYPGCTCFVPPSDSAHLAHGTPVKEEENDQVRVEVSGEVEEEESGEEDREVAVEVHDERTEDDDVGEI